MSAPQMTSYSALFGRVTWMFLGPMSLFLATFAIVSKASGWLTVADIAFFAVLGAMLLGRWLEFRSGQAQTGAGEPATIQHFRRYVVSVSVLGIGLWVIANLIGNHWLAQ